MTRISYKHARRDALLAGTHERVAACAKDGSVLSDAPMLDVDRRLLRVAKPSRPHYLGKSF